MDNRPIGVYDSGIGGLTGLKALRKLLPGEDFVFFGDSGRMPYGPRPRDELRRIAKQDMDFLAQFDVKAILAACGTISSAARPVLAEYPIPAFGVVDPALDALAAVPGDKPLCIIATAASIHSGEFTDALAERCRHSRDGTYSPPRSGCHTSRCPRTEIDPGPRLRGAAAGLHPLRDHRGRNPGFSRGRRPAALGFGVRGESPARLSDGSRTHE